MAEDRMLSDEVLLALIKKNSGGGGGGGTDDYNDLKNKPQIGGNTLVGNKTASDLGLVAAETGKGLSENDFTDEDKAIVGGVTAALAGKQGVLTTGSHIEIDDDTISVNRWAVPAGKVVYTVITSDENYGQNVHVQRHTPGGAFIDDRTFLCEMYKTVDVDGLISIQNPYASLNITLLKDSDEQQSGYNYTVSPITTPTSNSFTFTMEQEENDNDLIIRSELDAEVNAIKDGQSIDSFSDVETALALKQNATDNSLETEAKTIVGAINEHEGDIDSLKSGLTNYQAQNDLNLEVPDRKNVLENTANSATVSGVLYTVNNDGSVSVSTETQSSNISSLQINDFTLPAGEYVLNGCPSGGGSNKYELQIAIGGATYRDYGGGVSFTSTNQRCVVQILIRSGVTINDTFYPMIRPATITDPTFAPYIPSVNSRIEAVDFGILPNAVNYLPSVTIDACQLWKNGKVVNGNIKFTTSETIASGNFIISGIPKISTSAANGAAMGAVSFNKNGAFGALANSIDGTYGTVFLTAELSAGTYCASFSYISA